MKVQSSSAPGPSLQDVEQPAPKETTSARATASSEVAHPRTLWSRPVSGEWTVDLHGIKGDPVSLYVHGTQSEVKDALKGAGWTEAKSNTVLHNLEYVGAVPVEGAVKGANAIAKGVERLFGVKHGPTLPDPVKGTIQSMPVSNQTLNGKPPVFAFEKDNNPVGGRHHVRVFDTGKDDRQGVPVFALSGVHDTGITFSDRPEQLFLGHSVEKNVDPERDKIVRELRAAGAVSGAQKFPIAYGAAGAPGTHSEDGQAADVTLKHR